MGQMKQIDVLPDDVLLEFFDFVLIMNLSQRYVGKRQVEAWELLVHVCRRWRSLVFQSPRRLNLRLYCTAETPIREKLDVWPAALPLVVWDDMGFFKLHSDMNNIVAALEQSNRVCQVELKLGWNSDTLLRAMQVPFPELTYLRLTLHDESLPILPDTFLGGSAPRLQYFKSYGIQFPGLPNLLMSTTHLVELHLTGYSFPGYISISPTAMVALLSALSSLRILSLLSQNRPAGGLEIQSLSKRSILPALRRLDFGGDTGYLEDLLTRIDTPQLDEMQITFDQIDFDRSQLAHFINRTPTLRACDKARVRFDYSKTWVALLSQSRTVKIEMSCRERERDRQLSFFKQICNFSLHSPSTVEDLYIVSEHSGFLWNDDTIENTLWLQLLLPFTAVKNLYLSLPKQFAPGIAAALQEPVGRTITGALPDLRNIFVEKLGTSGPSQENIEQFVAAARQLSDRPVAIPFWDKVSNMKPV